MRADIHDGQERCSTKGRIHVRKTNLTISKTSCDARPVHTFGSGTIWAPDRPTVFYIDTVPIGLALTEMTERVTMRYLNGEYHREDSRLIRSAKPWQLTHSWTTEQDMPCGRFRVVAYSPKKGVAWSVS
jgi:hypothetical protein